MLKTSDFERDATKILCLNNPRPTIQAVQDETVALARAFLLKDQLDPFKQSSKIRIPFWCHETKTALLEVGPFPDPLRVTRLNCQRAQTLPIPTLPSTSVQDPPGKFRKPAGSNPPGPFWRLRSDHLCDDVKCRIRVTTSTPVVIPAAGVGVGYYLDDFLV